jgi:hypothetical protein
MEGSSGQEIRGNNYPRTCLEGLKHTTINLRQNSRLLVLPGMKRECYPLQRGSLSLFLQAMFRVFFVGFLSISCQWLWKDLRLDVHVVRTLKAKKREDWNKRKKGGEEMSRRWGMKKRSRTKKSRRKVEGGRGEKLGRIWKI